MSILSVASTVWAAAELPRHGVIGLAVEANAQNRVEVQTAVPGGAGAAAGIQAGDLIQSLDGAPVTTAVEFARAVTRHVGGDTVKVGIVHAGVEAVKTVVLKPRPLETSPYAEVMYVALPVRGSLRRAIVTRPKKAGRLPAVLLMQGVGCYSMDAGDRRSGYGRVVDELEQRGL